MIDYRVLQIKPEETHDWLLYKHYAKLLPSVIMFAYGLYDKSNVLQGVMTYGISGARENNKLGRFDIRELTRLVLNENLDKNSTSFFIAKTFKLLPKPLVLLSYSDMNFGHHGYIYQATNWIYTGLSKGRNTFVDKNGKEIHEKTIFDRYGTNKMEKLSTLGFTRRQKLPKHRYFYFIGNDKDKIEMKSELLKRYNIEQYPKGNNKRYDASYKCMTQEVLF